MQNLAAATLAATFVMGCSSTTSQRWGQEHSSYSSARSNHSREDNPKSLFARGLQYAKRGDYIRAEQYLVAAISAGLPKRNALPPMIQICLASSRIHAASKYAREYLRTYPEDWTIRLVSASLHLAAKRYDEARQDVEQVIEEQPEASMPRYMLARLLHEHFDDDKSARRHFEAYLKLSPSGEHAREVRNYLKYSLTDHEEEIL